MSFSVSIRLKPNEVEKIRASLKLIAVAKANFVRKICLHPTLSAEFNATKSALTESLPIDVVDFVILPYIQAQQKQESTDFDAWRKKTAPIREHIVCMVRKTKRLQPP